MKENHGAGACKIFEKNGFAAGTWALEGGLLLSLERGRSAATRNGFYLDRESCPP